MATGDLDTAASKPARLTGLQGWLQLLSTPVDAASLGVFRIVFGLAMAIDAWRYLAYGWVDVLYVQPVMHFHYFGFEFVEPWPGAGMRIHFWAVSILSLCVAAGLFYRASAAALFVAYLYVFLLDQAAYMNHHYLMLLIAFLLALMPAANAYSAAVDLSPSPFPGREGESESSPFPSREGGRGDRSVPIWCLWLLRFQLAIVYVYGALAKLDPDWLRAQPMRSTLARMTEGYPYLIAEIGAPLLAYVIAYSGLVADLLIPICLLIRRTRWVGVAAAVIFHGANAVALNIGVFSYLMLGMLPIFFEPDWPRRLVRRWRRAATNDDDARLSHGRAVTSPWLLAFLHLYVVVQLLVPLRHWLYPGAVRWSEEGHRFSWRMMLRTKHSELSLRVTDPDSGRSWTINPANDMTTVQLRELETYPDLVLQYVHFHRDRLRREGIREPMIFVDWFCSLNGRAPRRLADPQVDLAKVERRLGPASWIVPLDDFDSPS